MREPRRCSGQTVALVAAGRRCRGGLHGRFGLFNSAQFTPLDRMGWMSWWRRVNASHFRRRMFPVQGTSEPSASATIYTPITPLTAWWWAIAVSPTADQRIGTVASATSRPATPLTGDGRGWRSVDGWRAATILEENGAWFGLQPAHFRPSGREGMGGNDRQLA